MKRPHSTIHSRHVYKTDVTSTIVGCHSNVIFTTSVDVFPTKSFLHTKQPYFPAKTFLVKMHISCENPHLPPKNFVNSAYLAHFPPEPIPAKNRSRQNAVTISCWSVQFPPKCSKRAFSRQSQEFCWEKHFGGKIQKNAHSFYFLAKMLSRQNLWAINILAGNEHFSRR